MIYAAIVFLPLAGALIAGFFGRVIGARPCEIITTSFLMLAAVLSWIVFFQVALGHETHEVTLLRWITSGELDISWSLRVDTLTAVMLVVVTTVSSLVHLYSIGYMHDDPTAPALLRLSVALHLRDADAGDGRQSRADVLRLGRRRPRLLSAHRLLVQKPSANARRHQGLRRQPRWRFRFRARHLSPCSSSSTRSIWTRSSPLFRVLLARPSTSRDMTSTS